MAGACDSNDDRGVPACFWNAVEKYDTNPSPPFFEAPYNYAQVIYPGQAPIKCTINDKHPYKHEYKISCVDGYKYEIGTDYCSVNPTAPNCRKSLTIAISPSGQKTYHTYTWKGECRCTTQGAEQVILHRIFLGNKSTISTTPDLLHPAKSRSAARGTPPTGDILIITTHEFRE